MLLRVSLGMYSDKHIEQVVASGLGNRKLSPRIVFGYDSIVGPSRPDTIVVACGATTMEKSIIGWRRLP